MPRRSPYVIALTAEERAELLWRTGVASSIIDAFTVCSDQSPSLLSVSPDHWTVCDLQQLAGKAEAPEVAA